MLQPLSEYVLVEPEDRSKSAYSSKAGLLVAPPEFEGNPNIGRVHAVGSKVTTVKPGDRVVFKADKPRGFKHEGLKLFRLHIDQIGAIIKP